MREGIFEIVYFRKISAAELKNCGTTAGFRVFGISQFLPEIFQKQLKYTLNFECCQLLFTIK